MRTILARPLYEYLACIQLYLEIETGNQYHFLDDPAFAQLKHTLTATMKERQAQGLGSSQKQAEVITTEEEEHLWRTGVLGSDNPRTLIDTLLYLNGLYFALRAGKEHKNLMLHQL